MHMSESNHQMTEPNDSGLIETEGYFSRFLAFFEGLQNVNAALGSAQDGGRTDP